MNRAGKARGPDREGSVLYSYLFREYVGGFNNWHPQHNACGIYVGFWIGLG